VKSSQPRGKRKLAPRPPAQNNFIKKGWSNASSQHFKNPACRLRTRGTSWGQVLFIVHTDDIVLECEGTLPPGTSSHGYFNIHGDSPIGGQIKASNCSRIVFVDRAFHGRRSCSVQFLNVTGNAMFKVFVRRDKQRELLADQVKLFEALRDKFTRG
jgi:putative heme utilization carrier protein HutX